MKISTWETELTEWASRMLGAPFVYGETDCPMVCFGCYDAMTGENESGKYMHQWTDKKSAIRYTVKHKTNLLMAFRALGLEPVQKGFQQVGDIILAEDAMGWIRGHVCLGKNIISSSNDAGVSLHDTVNIVNAPNHVIHILRIP